MRYWQSSLLIGFLLVGLNTIYAQKKHSPDPDENTRIIEMATKLENEPLSKDAQDNRTELFLFMSSAPGLRIKLCPFVLGDMEKITGEYSSELIGQLAFSQIKYVLENSAKSNDDYSLLLAGVEGVIKTYKNIKKVKPKVKIDGLEEIIRKEEKGQLREFVKTNMKKCE
jgi:hypothetical protein